MKEIVVGIADGKVAVKDQMLISYALGSCVGICLYDSGRKIAGLAHIVLPDKKKSVNWDNPYKFADDGIGKLIEDMGARGAKRAVLTAKIAGGAKMFESRGPQWEIGRLNIEAVKSALFYRGIVVKGEDTGGSYGRTIRFYAEDGRLEVSTVRHNTIRL